MDSTVSVWLGALPHFFFVSRFPFVLASHATTLMAGDRSVPSAPVMTAFVRCMVHTPSQYLYVLR